MEQLRGVFLRACGLGTLGAGRAPNVPNSHCSLEKVVPVVPDVSFLLVGELFSGGTTGGTTFEVVPLVPA